MFVISEHTPSGYKPTRTNNIRDVYDIVLNITNDEKQAARAVDIASDMGLGGQYVFNKFKVECERE